VQNLLLIILSSDYFIIEAMILSLQFLQHPWELFCFLPILCCKGIVLRDGYFQKIQLGTSTSYDWADGFLKNFSFDNKRVREVFF
jgi:hypothetical protein